jgi:hypothetical protein
MEDDSSNSVCSLCESSFACGCFGFEAVEAQFPICFTCLRVIFNFRRLIGSFDGVPFEVPLAIPPRRDH